MLRSALISLARRLPGTSQAIERIETLKAENSSLQQQYAERDRQYREASAKAADLQIWLDRLASQAPDRVDTLVREMKKFRNEEPTISEIQGYNAAARDAWVAVQAKTLPAGTRILDVGAGTCPYKADFAHCHYEAHDFQQYEGYIDPERKEGLYGKLDYVSDILNLPVPDASFDAVLCTEVLEHVPEPGPSLIEMARVLRPGGVMLVTAPLGSGLHQEPYHFYGGYTPHFYHHFAEKGGLKIESIEENGGFFKLLSQECSRVAWTIEKHRELHHGLDDAVGELFGDILPRYLYRLEKDCFIPQHTVGYHVRATKL